MHFIGNRAIVLGDGSPNIQLVYNPAWISLSVFLPIIGLSIAFALAEYQPKKPHVREIILVGTGVFAGLSIVGMHYIGNFGISNYHLDYVPRFLVASFIIAIGDSLAVLILFYTWREKWISDWWKRVLCAVFLAAGVSAMHFTASTKCIYHLKHYNGPKATRSRNIQVIIAGILAVVGFIVLILVLIFRRHKARLQKQSSQKIMLACAMFDPQGRILVTTNGVLPSREITDKYNHRTFSEQFDTAHPVFQWIFRVTRNWAGVSELIPKMKNHLGAHRVNSDEDSSASSSASSARYDPDTYSDYSVVFRERFCTAAASLASSMQIPVQRIGVLFDRIIETGTLNAEDKVWKRSAVTPFKSFEDTELGLSSLFGKGQVLFLTRQLSSVATDRLLNAGFKFGTVHQVGRTIADTMQIPLAALDQHMTNIKKYVDNLTELEKTGTWLSCFALIPKVHSRGFDIAVKKANQDQLPDVQLLPADPLLWQTNFLKRMDKMTGSACIAFLEGREQVDGARPSHERQFALVIRTALNTLMHQIPAAWFQNSHFCAKPVYAHYSASLRSRAPTTTLYSFVICADLHSSTEGWSSISRIPLSFFSLRQQCYADSPNHAVMARDIHQEFGPLLARQTVKSPSHKVKKISIHIPGSGHKKSASRNTLNRHAIPRINTENSDTSEDTYELVHKPSRRLSEANHQPAATPSFERDTIWGGILVNSETVVKSDSKSEFSNEYTDGLGMQTTTAVISTAKPEETFVDELFAFAKVVTPPKAGRESGF